MRIITISHSTFYNVDGCTRRETPDSTLLVFGTTSRLLNVLYNKVYVRIVNRNFQGVLISIGRGKKLI
jgi:hypothetical protein